MAKQTLVQIVDDLDGTVVNEGEGETISFALRGVEYEIDLKNANVDKFDKALAKYVEVATRVGGRKRTKVATGRGGDKSQMQAIRQWARENGWEVSDRGRIPQDVVEAFDEAH